MPGRLKPKRFTRHDCSELCTLGVFKLGEERAQLVHTWFEQGKNNDTIVALAATEGFKLSGGSVGRHRANHLREWKPSDDDPSLAPATPDDVEGMSDLEILRLVIKRGAQGVAAGAKVDTRTMMQALDMYYKMTQGSAFADMIAALSAAADQLDDEDEDEAVVEAPEAIGDPYEVVDDRSEGS